MQFAIPIDASTTFTIPTNQFYLALFSPFVAHNTPCTPAFSHSFYALCIFAICLRFKMASTRCLNYIYCKLFSLIRARAIEWFCWFLSFAIVRSDECVFLINLAQRSQGDEFKCLSIYVEVVFYVLHIVLFCIFDSVSFSHSSCKAFCQRFVATVFVFSFLSYFILPLYYRDRCANSSFPSGSMQVNEWVEQQQQRQQ